MNRRVLIINADDANLTAGIDRAILESHERGAVTSTSFLVNLETDAAGVRRFRACKRLGIGLHLNVSLGRPVSRAGQVRSLLDPEGVFRRPASYRVRPPDVRHVSAEYRAQILGFRKLFGRMPTHLDTHHHLHDRAVFFQAVLAAAREWRLPVRRSRQVRPKTAVRTPDYLFMNLTPEGYWRREALGVVLKNLPPGTSEVVCHPGYDDRDLRSVSSFSAGRERERKLFGAPGLKKWIFENSIVLSHYGLCYTCP